MHRSEDDVNAELDWVVHLANHDVPVAAPVGSIEANLIERVDVDGSHFTAYAFEEAPGRHPKIDDFTPEWLATYGALMGKMHRVTQGYQPPHGAKKRFHWYNDPTIDPLQYESINEPEIVERLLQQVDVIKTFQPTERSYGMVHNDLHGGNIFTHYGQITAFDFDDCHYNFFANDIAMALFYALRMPESEPGDANFARHFLAHFLQGYRREQSIDSVWLERIPAFLKLREIDLYLIIQLHDRGSTHPWVVAYMDGRRERILQEQPIMEIDFSDF